MEKRTRDNKDLPEELREVWGELDEHLETLNQNTAEVGILYEHLDELDARMQKLIERFDTLQTLLLTQQTNAGEETRPLRLTPKEEGVLCALARAKEPVTSASIAKETGLTIDLAAQMLFCLTQKGIPIHAHNIGETTFYVLPEELRNIEENTIKKHILKK